MGRLLIWLLIAAWVWWAWRARRRPPTRPAAPPAAQAPRMACCQHCGVHLPTEESVRDAQGLAYCSTGHRTLGPGAQA